MTIAEIKRFRQLQGVTQLELGQRARIHSTRICKSERGYVSLRAEELQELEKALRAAIRDRKRKLGAGMADLETSESQGASESANKGTGLEQLVCAPRANGAVSR